MSHEYFIVFKPLDALAWSKSDNTEQAAIGRDVLFKFNAPKSKNTVRTYVGTTIAYIPLSKAQQIEDEEGVLTDRGNAIIQAYAQKWVQNQHRDVEVEMLYPQLMGLFQDILIDPELAEESARS